MKTLSSIVVAVIAIVTCSLAMASDVSKLYDGKYTRIVTFAYTGMAGAKERTTVISLRMQVDDDSECRPKLEYWWENEGKLHRPVKNPRLEPGSTCEPGEKPRDR